MIENLNELWSAMALLERIYWLIAIPTTLIFLIYMVMTFIGGDLDADTDIDADIDTDADFDTDADADTGIPYQFITIKNLLGFLTIFSWTGLAFIHGGYGVLTVLVSSTIAGLIMMFIMATIFYLMSKLTESGNENLRKAVGGIGEVYLVIKAERKGMGKVQLKLQGTFRTLDAITDEKNDLPTGSLVDIIDITNNNILIVKSSSK
jgi:hypothetical protein